MTEPVIRANDAALQIFQQIVEEMKEIRLDTRDLRDRMIRIEAMDFMRQIDDLKKDAEKRREEVEKIKTESASKISDLKTDASSKIADLKTEVSVLKTRVAPLFAGIVIIVTLVGNYVIRLVGH